MKRFIFKLCVFIVSIPLGIALVCFCLPATPEERNFSCFSIIEKDALLKREQAQRIILIGGSNVIFGINGQMLKDSLQCNPVNTGIDASVGLTAMLSHNLPYIKKGDIVLVIPEYNQFFDGFSSGGLTLLMTTLDVPGPGIRSLSTKQLMNVAKFFPTLCLMKLDPSEYFYHADKAIVSPNLRNGFDTYGDVSAHWKLKHQAVIPTHSLGNVFNPDVIVQLIDFKKAVEKRQATFLLSYPSFQKSSFQNCRAQVMSVQQACQHAGLTCIGTPEQYVFADSAMFDTFYHLTKNALDLRTSYLVNELKAHLVKQ